MAGNSEKKEGKLRANTFEGANFNSNTGSSCFTISDGGALGLASGKNIFMQDAGSKIGTGTGQKIGFWNATPVVQPTTTLEDGTNGNLATTAILSGAVISMMKVLSGAGLLNTAAHGL